MVTNQLVLADYNLLRWIPLIPLLSENFSRIVYVSAHRLDPALILREKPDVVIEEMVERAMFGPAGFPMPEPPR